MYAAEVSLESSKVFAIKPFRKSLLIFLAAAVLLVVVYSFVFLFLMASAEGRSYTIVDAVYWVITTMTTQGLGDIVFVSSAGRMFAVLVDADRNHPLLCNPDPCRRRARAAERSGIGADEVEGPGSRFDRGL